MGMNQARQEKEKNESNTMTQKEEMVLQNRMVRIKLAPFTILSFENKVKLSISEGRVYKDYNKPTHDKQLDHQLILILPSPKSTRLNLISISQTPLVTWLTLSAAHIL
ncbi:unnamed protein product [Prunus brigantina]